MAPVLLTSSFPLGPPVRLHAGWPRGKGLRKRCNPDEQRAKAEKEEASEARRRQHGGGAAAKAAPPPPPIVSGIGHKLLQMMGWTAGTGLGKTRQGLVEPVSSTMVGQKDRDKRGLGQLGSRRGLSRRGKGGGSGLAGTTAETNSWLATGGATKPQPPPVAAPA